MNLFRFSRLWVALLMLYGLLLTPGCFEPSQKEGHKQLSHLDDFGDPLPPGAIARIGTTRLRSGGYLAVSRDGKLMASSLAGPQLHSICVWETKSGKKRLDIDCEDRFLAISPDGKTLASCGKRFDMSVRLWDMLTGKLLREIQVEGEQELPHQGIGRVVFVSDGKSLAVSGGHVDQRGMPAYPWFTAVRLLDVETGELLRTFTAPDENGRGWIWMDFCFSPDGKTMSMVGGKDQTVYLWETSTGKLLRTLGSDESTTTFSTNGRVLAIAGYNAIRLIELSSGKELRSFTDFDGSHGSPDPIALSPNGNLIAMGGATGDRVIRVWGAKTGHLIREFPLFYNESVRDLVFLHDNTTIIATSGASIRSWNLVNGREKLLANVFRRPVNCVVFSPDGKTLALCGNDPGVRVHDVATRKLLRHFSKDEHIREIAFALDGKKLVAAGLQLCLWDTTRGKLLQTFQKSPTGLKRSLAFSAVGFLPSGQEIVAPSYDGILRVWNINSSKQVRQFPQGRKYDRHPMAINYMALPPDGNRLAIHGPRWKIHLWDCKTGEQFTSLSCYDFNQAHRPMAISPDGRLIAFEVNQNTVAIQEITGEQREILLDNGQERRSLYDVSVAFSPNNKLLATGSFSDNSVRLWDVATGKKISLFEGHLRGVTYLDFSPDGKILATASFDGTVLLWDVTSMKGPKEQ